jgi:hypothetical protein
MKHKRFAASVIGILVILIYGTMAWQVTPVSAGFTPTTPPTATVTSTTQPTATFTPTVTRTPTAVFRTATGTATTTGTVISPSNTLVILAGTPGMPVTGGATNGDVPLGGISMVFLAADLILIIVAISMVIRQLFSTRSQK